MISSLRFALAVACLALAALDASAGRLHPRLEQKLRDAAPGETIPVIVEMKDQMKPAPPPARLSKAVRKARVKALVAALKDRADRGQLGIRAELAQQQALGAVRRMQAFWIFNGVALTANEAVIRRLAARDDVLEVRTDELIPPPPMPASAQLGSGPAEWNIALIRAPEVWALDPDYNGAGVVVGSFDTGVDVSHPDLFPGYRGNDAISWFDPYGQHSFPYDFHGHGTHTTGTAVGGSAGGTHIGVAPGAKWIAAKAWADDGTGFTSDFHRIFEWFLAPGGDPANAPDVVINSWALSLGGCITEFQADIQAWRAAGIFPAFAAGNSGSGAGSVRSPGAYAEAFAVGATDILDEVASFSSRGPSPCGGAVKPDMSAPGDSVRSSIPGGYATFSGTSMATPHVAGAVAVLRSIKPELTLDELAEALKAGATDVATPGLDNASGAGRLDLLVSAEIAVRGADTPLVKVLATQPTANEAGPTAGVLTFSRTGSTDADLEVTFAVSGTATPGVDYVPIPTSITIPAGAASAQLAVMPIDDAVLEVNESVSVDITPNAAYIAAASRVAAVMIISDELFPDLVASALSAPAVAGAGESITLTETTKNQGGGAAPASTTRYFLSSDTALDTADQEIAARSVPALAPGASSAGSVVAVIPPQTLPGTWHLMALADAAGAVPETDEANNLAGRSLKIGADLYVQSLSASTTAAAGDTILVADTTQNQGGGTAAPSQTRLFLSANTLLDPAVDIPLGSREVGALSPGASDTGTTSVVLPEGTATGNWYIIASADAAGTVPETLEGNNIRTRLVRIGPDLNVSALSVPAVAAAGQSLSVTETTQNQGGGAAGASLTRIYLSSNSALDDGDEVLAARSVPALAGNASDTATTTVTLPDGLAAGTWFLIAKADALDVVAETIESNNVTARSIKLGADLTVSALSVPTVAGPGDSITLGESTDNAGGGDAGSSQTHYFLSANATYDGADTWLATRSVPALAAGASSAGSLTVTIPADTAPGNWYLIAKADSTDLVLETSETNNTAARLVKIGSDLIVSALSAPTTAGEGQSITITETTKNQGGGTADASTTRYFLSSDTTLDESDVAIGSRAVPALPTGTSSSGSTLLTIPPGWPTDDWYLIAAADHDDVVIETSETNNIMRRTVQIGPDLAVSALTVPSAASAGQVLTVSDTTRNQGGGSVSASQTRYFFSSNSVFDADDVELGVRNVPALAPGATNSGSLQIAIPSDATAGNWYIVARADSAQAVAETNEANNNSSRSVRLGADLTVSALSAPTGAAPGQSIALLETTRNQGGATAGPSQTRYFLSSDTTFDAGDRELGARNVPALAPGASSNVSTPVLIPVDVSAGKWYLLAVADFDGTVEEASETNNTKSRLITIAVQ
jgi:subtilisin family serine protease/subtilase family serine protease